MQQKTSLIYTERALSWHTRKSFMLTNLACTISNLRGEWDYFMVQRLPGFRAQKAEKMLLKIINEWLCNVWLFPKVWILEISIKAFLIFGSVSGSRLKAVFGYPDPVANSLSCRISNRQTGSWSYLLVCSNLGWFWACFRRTLGLFFNQHLATLLLSHSFSFNVYHRHVHQCSFRTVQKQKSTLLI